MTPDREWIAFAARTDHLLDPSTPLRDPTYINYPLKSDPSVFPLHVGHLSRKTPSSLSLSSLKSSGGGGWREGYYVLTPAGFLHEFKDSDASRREGQVPVWSVFLPNCTLGPASAPGSSKGHIFHIEGRKDGDGTGRSKGSGGGGLKKLFHPSSGDTGVGAGYSGTTPTSTSGGKAWTFKARSHEEMMEWWNDIRMLCARYLVASESVRRSGPVEEAVRNVGYGSEGEWESEDEEEGYLQEEEAGGHYVSVSFQVFTLLTSRADVL